MGKKKSNKAAESDSDMEFNMEDDYMSDEMEKYNDEQINSDGSDENEDGASDDENDNGASDDDDDENDNEFSDDDEDDKAVDEEAQRGVEMEELEKEYKELKNEEQDILRNLKGHKDEDYQKGQAVKNQMALWDKALEIRFLLQKAYASSNRLPQEPVRSSFCEVESEVSEAYSSLIASSKKTLNSILELQQALIANNPSIAEAAEVNSNVNGDTNEEWSQISQMQTRMSSFRNKSIDKWQRKTQLTTGAAAIKDKLHAFNQSVSEQVASYMRDPSKMIKGMQANRSSVVIFGNVSDSSHDAKPEEFANGDPELLDDSDFYQQLLKEFFESVDPSGSETAFHAMKGSQTKKRKIVDRRASKSRKIRYHVHEKIVNFMAPRPADVPPMATQLFGDLFGLKRQKPPSAA